MMDGTALMPAFTAAIANGEAPASPERAVSAESSERTTRPTQKMVTRYSSMMRQKTRRAALGMLWRGLRVSAPATEMFSTLEKA